ncbi:MAG: MoaD/ThiS family protein [Kofleriaceae bacterium]
MVIKLSGNLLRFSNFQNEIEVSAPSILAGIHELVEGFPELRKVLLDGQGSPRAIHRLFLNGALIARDDVSRTVTANDELSILTAIAGG